jgi:hypothetical protein
MVAIDQKEGRVSVIPTSQRGTVGNAISSRGRRTKYLEIPHYAHYDAVMANEVSGVRKFGSSDEMETVLSKRDEKLQDMHANHEVTWEFARACAIRGVLFDYIDDETDPELIYEWHTALGQQRTTHNFNWNTTDDLRIELVKAKRKAEAKLVGMQPTKWIWLTPPPIHDEIVTSESVKSAYDRWQDGAHLRGDWRGGFPIADNVEIVSYEQRQIGNLKFLPDDESYLIPMLDDYFQVRFGPADTEEAVNTIGLPLYTMAEPMPFGRGSNLCMESNHLHFTERPEAIVQIKAA